jgi:hypothetical protein
MMNEASAVDERRNTSGEEKEELSVNVHGDFDADQINSNSIQL